MWAELGGSGRIWLGLQHQTEWFGFLWSVSCMKMSPSRETSLSNKTQPNKHLKNWGESGLLSVYTTSNLTIRGIGLTLVEDSTGWVRFHMGNK